MSALRSGLSLLQIIDAKDQFVPRRKICQVEIHPRVGNLLCDLSKDARPVFDFNDQDLTLSSDLHAALNEGTAGS